MENSLDAMTIIIYNHIVAMTIGSQSTPSKKLLTHSSHAVLTCSRLEHVLSSEILASQSRRKGERAACQNHGDRNRQNLFVQSLVSVECSVARLTLDSARTKRCPASTSTLGGSGLKNYPMAFLVCMESVNS